jgi:hypothetical protein
VTNSRFHHIHSSPIRISRTLALTICAPSADRRGAPRFDEAFYVLHGATPTSPKVLESALGVHVCTNPD